MRFSLNDYLLDANCYRIWIFQKPLTVDDYYTLTKKFKYYCGKHGVSFLAVYSTTESDTARQAAVHTGKRGRPKKIVTGEKTDGHMHCIIKGTKDKSAYSATQEIEKSLNKKFKRNICKVDSLGKGNHAYNFINYCWKQADVFRTGGDFDYKHYLKKYDYFS